VKLEVFERYPGQGVEYIELIAERGDRFEMAVLEHLLNKKLLLLPNDDGIHSIFAIPTSLKVAKGLGRMKSIISHLDESGIYNRTIVKVK